MVLLLAIDGEVIKENLHKSWNIFTKDLHDDSVECCRCRLESEHHYHGNKHPPFGDERCLLLVVGVHPDLIITAEPV